MPDFRKKENRSFSQQDAAAAKASFFSSPKMLRKQLVGPKRDSSSFEEKSRDENEGGGTNQELLEISGKVAFVQKNFQIATKGRRKILLSGFWREVQSSSSSFSSSKV